MIFSQLREERDLSICSAVDRKRADKKNVLNGKFTTEESNGHWMLQYLPLT